jgi:uncharacterized protein (TIGR02145 family)
MKQFIFSLVIVIMFLNINAQVGINTDNSLPDPSAGLDLKFNNKGFLLPRLTYEQRTAISGPADGLMIYCTNCNVDGTGVLSIFQGGQWKVINLLCLVPVSPAAGTHVPAATVITWNWNTVPIATGYKWNTVNDYTTATDMIATTTKTETGLICGTTYARYVWAYNTCGPSNVTILTQSTLACGGGACPSSLTDARDGRVYNTVLIGSQCWMAQNLNIGTKISLDLQQTDNSIIEKYCYSGSDANCDIYGGLYQWAETVQYLNGATNVSSWWTVPTGNVTGICPVGWHIPTSLEYTVLINLLGGTSVAGGKMKETGLAHWTSPNAGATNSSGFTGLPAGYGAPGFIYEWLHETTFFWSASQTFDHAQTRYLYYGSEDSGENAYDKKDGFSVRCLMD